MYRHELEGSAEKWEGETKWEPDLGLLVAIEIPFSFYLLDTENLIQPSVEPG